MKKYLMLIPALLAIASCAEEVAGDAIQQSKVQEKVFTCSLENDASKVYVDDQSRLYWNEGDLVSIFTRGLNEKYMFAGKDGDVGGTFTFVGQQTFGTGSPMSANYAVYPYYDPNNFKTATYNQIKKNFHNMFRRLFNGGRAELKLADPTNILTSGIDIYAQPPGKKLENIALLSGGEKTMTAVALLFATLLQQIAQ